MKIIFTKYADEGNIVMEFEVNEVRYSGWLVGIDIVDIGWRTVTSDQYDTFEIIKE